MPWVGRIGHHELKTSSNMMPVQNTGALKPNNDTPVTRWLESFVGRCAAYTPRIVPPTMAMNSAEPVRSRVGHNRLMTKSDTGVWYW